MGPANPLCNTPLIQTDFISFQFQNTAPFFIDNIDASVSDNIIAIFFEFYFKPAFKPAMFQSEEQLPRPSDSNRQFGSECSSFSSLKDEIISLNHRLTSMEHNLTAKIDRQECLTLLQRKVNHNHLRKIVDEIKQSFIEQKRKEEQIKKDRQEEHEKGLKQLMERLRAIEFNEQSDSKQILGSRMKNTKKMAIKVVKPQQLYLESNETMFSMLVEQLSRFKADQSKLEKMLESKQRNTVSLNNQVCRKLQRLQNEIEAVALDRKLMSRKKHSEESSKGSYWTEVQGRRSMTNNHLASEGMGNFEMIKLENMSQSLQSVQKEVMNKINLKDLLPLIRKNLQPIGDELNNMKSYFDESLESMRKILLHQSEINEQLCGSLRVGWWQSQRLQLNEGMVSWDKELINMYPEGFLSKKGSDQITIGQQGLYLVSVHQGTDSALTFHSSEDNTDPQDKFTLLVDEERHPLNTKSKVIRITKNAKVSVISTSLGEVYLMMQKL